MDDHVKAALLRWQDEHPAPETRTQVTRRSNAQTGYVCSICDLRLQRSDTHVLLVDARVLCKWCAAAPDVDTGASAYDKALAICKRTQVRRHLTEHRNNLKRKG